MKETRLDLNQLGAPLVFFPIRRLLFEMLLSFASCLSSLFFVLAFGAAVVFSQRQMLASLPLLT